MLNRLANLPDKKSSWAMLFASALGLLLAALYFQHGMDLQPCVKCIYQRTAVVGILLAALLPMLSNNMLTRLIGLIGWGASSVWGLMVAIEHVDIQTAANPFFAACDAFPQFPAFMPLHEWMPNLFGAPGSCDSIDWQFLGMSMPQWMIVVFAIYTGVLAIVVLSRLGLKRHL